jgi:hypothetical protein
MSKIHHSHFMKKKTCLNVVVKTKVVVAVTVVENRVGALLIVTATLEISHGETEGRFNTYSRQQG